MFDPLNHCWFYPYYLCISLMAKSDDIIGSIWLSITRSIVQYDAKPRNGRVWIVKFKYYSFSNRQYSLIVIMIWDTHTHTHTHWYLVPMKFYTNRHISISQTLIKIVYVYLNLLNWSIHSFQHLFQQSSYNYYFLRYLCWTVKENIKFGEFCFRI